MTRSQKELINQFSAWRATARRGRVPNHLKRQVVALFKHHSPKDLAKQLGLKYSTLCKWQKGPHPTITTSKPKRPSIDFVSLPSIKAPKIFSDGKSMPITFTLKLSGGMELILSGQKPSDLVELTTDVVKRLSA